MTNMKGFAGFVAGQQPTTPVPNAFFTELLPEIDHLAELKVTLHLFWLMAQQKGERQCASDQALVSDRRLLDGLISPEMAPEEALADALERAVARGTLLRVTAGEGAARRAWYLINSARGRRALQDLIAGKWTPAEPGQPVYLEDHRPNIFVLYEQNLGALAPLLVQELMEAESTYPASWIADAFREAVTANVRKWSYVRAILQRWAVEGRTDETSRRSDEGDWRRFL
jgi:DNA replication protein